MAGPDEQRLPSDVIEALSVLDEEARCNLIELLVLLDLNTGEALKLSGELVELSKEGGGKPLTPILETALRFIEMDRDLSLKWVKLGPKLAECYPTGEFRSLEEICLMVAQHSPSVAIRCAEALPELSHLPAEQRGAWARLGAKLSERNPQVARRYFSHSPRIFVEGRPWNAGVIELGTQIVDSNIYQVMPVLLLGTIAFSSTPARVHDSLFSLAEDIAGTSIEAVKMMFRAVGSLASKWTASEFEIWTRSARQLCDQPVILEAFMAASPKLACVTEPYVIVELVKLAMRVAERDVRVAAVFLRNSHLSVKTAGPEKLWAWIENGLEMALGPMAAGDISDWSRAYRGDFRNLREFGMNALGKMDPVVQRAVAFFGLQTLQSRSLLQEVSAGISMQSVRAPLTNFMRAMTGEQVEVSELKDGPVERIGFTDPMRLELPANVSIYSGKSENYEHYLLAAAYHGARMEFGGFKWLGIPDDGGSKNEWRGPPDFPPGDALLSDVFEIAEGYRIERRLRTEYPGLAQGLDREAGRACESRAEPGMLPAAVAVVEAMVRRALMGDVAVEPPERIREVFEECWGNIEPLRDAGATVDDAWTAAKTINGVLQGFAGKLDYGGVEPIAHHGLWEFEKNDGADAATPAGGEPGTADVEATEINMAELLEVLRAQGEDVSQFEPPMASVEFENADGEAVTEMPMVRTDSGLLGGEESDEQGKLHYYPGITTLNGTAT